MRDSSTLLPVTCVFWWLLIMLEVQCNALMHGSVSVANFA